MGALERNMLCLYVDSGFHRNDGVGFIAFSRGLIHQVLRLLTSLFYDRFRYGMYMDLSGDREELFRRLRREISDDDVLKAMERVPRELFVPVESYAHAYDDIPLPIGEGQTISQPFIVGMMTQALRIDKSSKVLELGTGSGYQTAILAELAGQVVTVERLPRLSQAAEGILRSLGYKNISFNIAGKGLGWPDEAPYDAILVTAAAPKVPQALLDQLKIGGRLVIPVGARSEQSLLQVVKREGGTEMNHLTGCRFVPLIGEDAWGEDGR
jgi:protein-L-isoaspartate(D-aspartate) O-methyltransferase